MVGIQDRSCGGWPYSLIWWSSKENFKRAHVCSGSHSHPHVGKDKLNGLWPAQARFFTALDQFVFQPAIFSLNRFPTCRMIGTVLFQFNAKKLSHVLDSIIDNVRTIITANLFWNPPPGMTSVTNAFATTSAVACLARMASTHFTHMSTITRQYLFPSAGVHSMKSVMRCSNSRCGSG